MRVLIITEENVFYLPLSIDYVLENLGPEVLEVVCARNPLLPSKFAAAGKFFNAFGSRPLVSYGWRLFKAKTRPAFPWLDSADRYYSIKHVCKKHNTEYLYSDNINSPDFLHHCQNLNIDLIASVSATQIFKERLINLPPHGCINIHTAKLPNYRGLYPTYWAMACGEKSIGICVHYIEKGIDTGRIILQDEVEIPASTTLDHMLKVTKLKGAELLIKAIKQIAEGTVRASYPEGQGSYFSFPTAESYRQFKNHGYKLW